MTSKPLWFQQPASTGPRIGQPRLASWDAATHPSQQRLKLYLDEVEQLLQPAPGTPWVLRLDVGLLESEPLLDNHDLDNYAYPLTKRIGNDQLVSVWVTKHHSPSSTVTVEQAQLGDPPPEVLHVTTTASTGTVRYKEQIHAALEDQSPLPAGPLHLQLAFNVGPRRNWLNLWKPTIDSLGPLLGGTTPNRPWHPHDGRITTLGLHRNLELSLSDEVTISIAIAPAEPPP